MNTAASTRIAKKVLVVAPDEPGFRQYADDLASEAQRLPAHDFQVSDPLYFSPLSSTDSVRELVERIAFHHPDLVHIHHEFGFMGSKIPGRYRFVELKKRLRERLPQVKLVATAHTVIRSSFEYPWKGRGWQTPLRLAANLLLLPSLKRLWSESTWGDLDGVMVHSALQVQDVKSSGCPRVREIPHYVPRGRPLAPKKGHNSNPPDSRPILLVFGYFTPEKGQDVVIRAMAHLKTPAQLILAGGIRREADRPYLKHCENLVQELGLSSKVTITGFITFEELDTWVGKASLVLLPFRETSGSGSLADLMTRRAPVLASDLPLNLEIGQRSAGALEYFRSDDPVDCAQKMDSLLNHPESLENLRQAAETYAREHSPELIVRRQQEFYRELF